MYVTELHEQLEVAAQHDAQEETVTVLTQRRQKTQQGETEARVLSLHQGTQVFPHSPNQHPSLRGQGQQIVALSSLVPDSLLHNYTIQS